jgi:hypothetical protein
MSESEATMQRTAAQCFGPSVQAAVDEALTLLTVMSAWVEHQCDAEEVCVDQLWNGFSLLHSKTEEALRSIRNRVGEPMQ